MEMVAIIAFGIQIAAFVPAFVFQTEKFYDLTGSLTYIVCGLYSFLAGPSALDDPEVTDVVATALLLVWALRLGSFLFLRVTSSGGDDRFDAIKPDFLRFLLTWIIQGLWVFLTAYPVFIANATRGSGDFGAVAVVGLVIWVLGFGIEVVADRQKSTWRKDPANRGKFIEYGLWYYSRHPNYLGEVTLWFGMFVLCSPDLSGTQFASVISPVFVFCLIYFVSGVRLLEKKADSKWGGQPDYENYKANTSVFLLLPKGKKRTHDGNSAA
mmetsp:Transcript_14809/g.37452  ORF Transcript_14809/g.37452 Transcript_14809/m.37452 type:complete len:268 (-) Transcript_14809:116-919(-)